jgi:hypothetical protein
MSGASKLGQAPHYPRRASRRLHAAREIHDGYKFTSSRKLIVSWLSTRTSERYGELQQEAKAKIW